MDCNGDQSFSPSLEEAADEDELPSSSSSSLLDEAAAAEKHQPCYRGCTKRILQSPPSTTGNRLTLRTSQQLYMLEQPTK